MCVCARAGVCVCVCVVCALVLSLVGLRSFSSSLEKVTATISVQRQKQCAAFIHFLLRSPHGSEFGCLIKEEFRSLLNQSPFTGLRACEVSSSQLWRSCREDLVLACWLNIAAVHVCASRILPCVKLHLFLPIICGRFLGYSNVRKVFPEKRFFKSSAFGGLEIGFRVD